MKKSDSHAEDKHRAAPAGAMLERKRQQEILRLTREQLSAMVKAIPIPIVVARVSDGSIVYANGHLGEMLGLPPEELIGRKTLDFYQDPSDRQRLMDAMDGEGRVSSWEIRLKKADGTPLWLVGSSQTAVWDGEKVLIGAYYDVTDRRRAEETLKTQARVLESMVEGVNVCAENAKIFFTNPAFDAMFGYKRGELAGQHVSVLNADSPEDFARIAEDVQTKLKQAGSWHGEFNNVRKDGTLFTTSAHISALEVSGKTYLISVQEDITERKRDEDARSESDERIRLIVDTASDAFISMDAGGLITDWNAQAEAIFGWPRAETVGRKLSDTIIPPLLREAHERGLSHFLATGEGPVLNNRIEITAQHRDGHEFPAELAVWVVGSGEDCSFNAFVHDITERKQAEEALRESETRYRDLYDDAPLAYFSVGTDGRIVRANRGASELLGYSVDSLIGRPVIDLYADAPAGKAKAKLVVERFRRGQETLDEEMEMRRADGTPVWISLTVRVVRDAQGQPLETRSIVLDITERKRAEEALRMAREDLNSRAEGRGQGTDNGFSIRELTVLNLVASGRADKEIGVTLGISARTVQKHVEKLCKKMGASNRTEASVQALRQGLID